MILEFLLVLVSALHCYPVKGCRGSELSKAAVEPWGLAGDRRWMLVDEAGRFLTQRQHPRLASVIAEISNDGLLLRVGDASLAVPNSGDGARKIPIQVWDDRLDARDAGDDAAGFFARVLGGSFRLVYMDDPAGARAVDGNYGRPDDRVSFADGFPVLLVASESLADLNTRLDHPVPMDRFRPNIVVEGDRAWAEDRWRQVRVGTVVFDIVKPCARCVVTTIDQDHGRKDPANEPIWALQQFRRDRKGQVLFGQNLIPRTVGLIQVGDPVEILN